MSRVLARLVVVALLATASLSPPVHAGGTTLVLPESRLNPGEFDGNWWHVQAAYGVQNVLFMGQPPSPQLMVEGRAGWGRCEVFLQAAGLNTHLWGGLGLRTRLADQERKRVNLVLDYLVSLPSKTSLHLGLGVTLGQDFARGGWRLGAQLGLASSPEPNGRPAGANLILDGYVGLWVKPLTFLSVNLDVSTTPFTTAIIPGLVLDFGGFPLERAPALAGLQIRVMEPLNLIHAPAYQSEVEGAGEFPARVELQPLFPGFIVHYGYKFL